MGVPVGIPVLDRLDRTLVMGIVNVTPDSFADDVSRPRPQDAIAHARALLADGADIIDVGGESTRPGADRLTVEQERARVLPVVQALVAEGAVVSIDTMHADVAVDAVAAGARIVNDVSGGLADPRMHRAVAELGVPYVLMHWRRDADGMTHAAHYGDVVGEVVAEVRAQVDAAVAAGIDSSRIIVDPGLGFAKEPVHSWAMLRGLDRLQGLGLPVLVGASRKRFLGALLADADGTPRPVDARDAASAAVVALAAARGYWGVRVHDVAASADAVRVAAAWPQEERDRIAIHGIRAFGHHGVLDREKRDGQEFSADLVLELDTRSAGRSDDLHDTVDYGQFAEQVHAVLAGPPRDLLEAVAQDIADTCLADPRVQAVTVTVHKPHAPITVPFDDVTVTIRRTRHG